MLLVRARGFAPLTLQAIRFTGAALSSRESYELSAGRLAPR